MLMKEREPVSLVLKGPLLVCHPSTTHFGTAALWAEGAPGFYESSGRVGLASECFQGHGFIKKAGTPRE